MNLGFWAKLKKPIMAMAPMANVTDAAFRRMFADARTVAREAGDASAGPDIFWTEFVSVEGLLSEGREQLAVDFWKSEAERPIVAQIFGSKPEQFEKIAAMVCELGFDGVDINMGCPDKGIEKSGAGASLIKNPELAKKIIRATKRGAGDIPVSVKTRIGYSKNEIANWIPVLLEEKLAALTVHLRTRNEMSDVPAHWDLAREIVALRDRIAPETLVLGNGDVASLKEAHARVAKTGFDGIMIGRGIFGNPWLFTNHIPDTREKLAKMIEHTELFEKMYRSNIPRPRRDAKSEDRPLKNFDIMKKHFKAYCSGFDGAKELRMQLMATENASEVRKITEAFILNL